MTPELEAFDRWAIEHSADLSDTDFCLSAFLGGWAAGRADLQLHVSIPDAAKQLVLSIEQQTEGAVLRGDGYMTVLNTPIGAIAVMVSVDLDAAQTRSTEVR
jgi:hypothetical protein